MPANSAAALYGKGIFTTIAVRGGTLLLWDKHWVRLTRDAAKVGVEISDYTETFVFEGLVQALKDKGIVNGRARISFMDQRPGIVWPGSAVENTAMSIITARSRGSANNFNLTTSPFRVNTRSPLAGVKSCNYLENILTLDEAKGRGFDEAVRANENGHVTTAAMANIFWLRDGVLHTPSLSTGCLPGTTREFILENLDCREVEVEMSELQYSDSIFLTSAGLGVAEVAEFESRQLAPSEHPIKTVLPWPNNGSGNCEK